MLNLNGLDRFGGLPIGTVFSLPGRQEETLQKSDRYYARPVRRTRNQWEIIGDQKGGFFDTDPVIVLDNR
ncbi:MAG: hypothetical protein M1150_03375 [Patescibacteria group bacterium]|nr:hypothetical protein [Patescibacteria group bacterium]